MPIGNIKKVGMDLEMYNIEYGKEYDGGMIYYVDNWENMEIEFSGYGNLILIFPFNNRKYIFTYCKKGKDRIYFEESYKGRFCAIYFEIIERFVVRNYLLRNNVYEIDNFFKDEGFNLFYLSNDLIHLRNKIKFAYGLEYYYESNERVLIFGLYNEFDLNFIREKNIGILWGGSDIMLDRKKRDEILEIIKEKKCINYAMSERIYNKLLELGIENVKKVVISFCWNQLEYKIRNYDNKKRKGIYIYDGLNKAKKKQLIYNQELVDKIVERLGKKFKIYRSSDGFVDNVIDIYRDCFVSLRLTLHDGNANSAQECGMLGIPVISNQEMNHCIRWECEEEIINKVKYIYNNNVKLNWRKDGVNLLFISGDIPGKGGGATFTGNLAGYLRGRGYNIWEMYLVHGEKFGIELNGRRFIVKFNHKRKWDILNFFEKLGEKDENFKIFLGNGCKIILRSSITDLKRLMEKHEVIFMSPGIYKNDLGKEVDIKNVNMTNIRNASLVKSYANSKLTQGIFQKYGLNEVGCLEINLLQIGRINNWGIRDIDCVFVVSNVERNIKNAKLFIEIAKNNREKKFVMISADNVKKKYENIELIINPKRLDEYYGRSKCLINCSYFDSMSNVVLEAINNGCHILVSENNGIVDYIGKEMRDKFVVNGYEMKNWEDKFTDILKEWENMEKDRKLLWEELKRKSWEVEIKLLELLGA